MEGIIYCYKSPSGKYYVGQTIRESLRHKEHKNRKGNCVKFKKAIEKYGFENFKYKVLIRVNCDESFLNIILNRLERMYIKKYNSFNLGYNMNVGGSGNKGLRCSLCTKNKISAKLKGRYTGNSHPFYGKRHTNKTKSLISSSLKGKTVWNKGNKLSDENKQRISSTLMEYYSTGVKPHNAKKVNQYTLEGEFIKTWDSASEAASYLFGAKNGEGVLRVCRGERNKYKSFLWKYNEGSQTIEK